MIEALSIAAFAARGDRRAVVTPDADLSYREVASEVTALARQLQAVGIVPGDRVAVQLANSAAAVIALLAAAAVGAIPVPVQAALRGGGLRKLAQDCDFALAICNRAQARDWDCRTLQFSTGGAAVNDWSQPAAPLGDLQSPAVILYTSGSTGGSKGVMLSRANMAAALAAVHEYLRPGADDVYYSALPLSSSYGFYQMVSALSMGATLVLDKSFAFPAHSLRLLAAHRATIFAAVPTQIAWLLESPNEHAKWLTTLRIITTAAAALPIEHARRLRRLLPQTRIFAMYGQTECKRISYLDPGDLDRKPGSVGRGLPIQRHLLLDSAGARVPRGEPGELVVQGPHVMLGYWRKPELTKEVMRCVPGEPGIWLYTGDEFREDEDGYLYFLGRRDEMLKIGGHKVSPNEIENIVLELAAISEVAVVGVSDPSWGSVAVAYVVLRPGAAPDAEALIRHCAARLPRYMVPRSVQFLDSMPKTESGKIRKMDLL